MPITTKKLSMYLEEIKMMPSGPSDFGITTRKKPEKFKLWFFKMLTIWILNQYNFTARILKKIIDFLIYLLLSYQL